MISVQNFVVRSMSLTLKTICPNFFTCTGVVCWLISRSFQFRRSLTLPAENIQYRLLSVNAPKTLLTAVLALIPFVGAAAVWAPVSLWLLYQQEYTAAVLLIVYGVGVISLADNVIKPWVLHGQSNLHPLLALLSVLGGVQALGPIGILVGPMVVVFLQTLLNILHRELTDGADESPRRRRRESLPLILSLRQTGLRLPYATPNRNRRVI